MKAFVLSGGNFMAECKAVLTYENDAGGRYQTTNGVTTDNQSTVLSYPSPDLAYSQIVGVLEPNPGGSEMDWRLSAGSSFQNNGHIIANDVGASPIAWAASASKLYNGPGGMSFYLGGHDYGSSSAIGLVNGRRMFLNTLFVPNTRPASCSFDTSSTIRTIAGTVYEDVNGDGSIADGIGRPSVRVRLYTDTNANGLVDAADTWLAQTTTDAAGAYSFEVATLASGNLYLVTVESKSLTPNAGYNPGFTQSDVWAEQTYGDDPSTALLDLGPRFGGRVPATSDNFAAVTTPASNDYQHLARVDVSAGSAVNVRFALSFNAVTHLRGGDSADDDTTANRTIQGAFRQVLQNATAVAGPTAMRFTPAAAAALAKFSAARTSRA